MSKQTKDSTPAFKGLNWYREQYFSLFVPMDWQKTQWPDERQGVLFVPSAEDGHTVFAVEITDMGTIVTADDLPYLAQGFFDAIKQLPERKIESKKESVTGKLVQLEAKYTFLENGETRKRWVRVLYQGTRQIAFTAQGKTVEAYDYWLPMFFEAMMTLNVHSVKPADPVKLPSQ